KGLSPLSRGSNLLPSFLFSPAHDLTPYPNLSHHTPILCCPNSNCCSLPNISRTKSPNHYPSVHDHTKRELHPKHPCHHPEIPGLLLAPHNNMIYLYACQNKLHPI
uniref:Uncharacterized protein n=1 Tax=Aquila chrysaetos chrysaetos TaxID=223781 RepID=A0A663E4S7_AQUCH